MAANRRQAIIDDGTIVGIDFVEVEPTAQVDLFVHFIGDPTMVFTPWPSTALTDLAQISIASLSSSATIPTVPPLSADWDVVDGHDVLHIVVAAPGDFSRYALTLTDDVVPSRVDPFFNGVAFRFQAGCPSDLDCKPDEPPCPPVDAPDVAIDYGARDFDSYRRALQEFASLRWPAWADRLEADVGTMLMETLCAVADEMSYYQDRVAREAALRTASERRSLRHHARLLDYEPHDGLAAWTWLRIDPDGVASLAVPWGTPVRTAVERDPGTGEPIGRQVTYETGRGLMDTLPDGPAPPEPTVRSVWSGIPAWIWDEDTTCLPAGSTEVSVEGQWVTGVDPLWTGVDRWVLLQSVPLDPAIALRRHVVRLTGAAELFDPIASQWTTTLRWDASEATPFAMSLEAVHDDGTTEVVFSVCANLVPAVAGRTVPGIGVGVTPLLFSIGEPTGAFTSPVRGAIERVGPDGSTCYLLPLDATERELLCWVGEVPTAAVAEVRLDALDDEADLVPSRWDWRRSLIGSPAAAAADAVFTLEDGLWGEVARYWRGEAVRHHDYRTPSGFTARFGDGAIGAVPPAGTVFRVTYRVGGGSEANVGADTLVETDLANVQVSNPLPVTAGLDPETAVEIRQRAPEAWKAVTYRAVRPEDYAEALTRLAWVQRAGARLRWTGSWLTLFATPDPRDAVTLAPEQRAEAEAQLERFRQAGRETHVMDPVYAWLDLDIALCVEPSAYRGAVKAAALEALFADGTGFLDPDRYSFGDPLRRSALQAALQGVAGVRAVERISVRRRGHFDWRDLTDELDVGDNEVIGIANDPLHPERGAVTLSMEGGA